MSNGKKVRLLAYWVFIPMIASLIAGFQCALFYSTWKLVLWLAIMLGCTVLATLDNGLAQGICVLAWSLDFVGGAFWAFALSSVLGGSPFGFVFFGLLFGLFLIVTIEYAKEMSKDIQRFIEKDEVRERRRKLREERMNDVREREDSQTETEEGDNTDNT